MSEPLDVRVQLGTFATPIEPDVMAELITSWIRPLIDTNVVFLRGHRVPPLYTLGRQGKVRYQEEDFGKEDFFDIPTVAAQGFADCEDLSAWRAAELRVAGYWAEPLVTWEAIEFEDGSLDVLFHVQVMTRNGVEDPSAILGMNSQLAWGARR